MFLGAMKVQRWSYPKQYITNKEKQASFYVGWDWWTYKLGLKNILSSWSVCIKVSSNFLIPFPRSNPPLGPYLLQPPTSPCWESLERGTRATSAPSLQPLHGSPASCPHSLPSYSRPRMLFSSCFLHILSSRFLNSVCLVLFMINFLPSTWEMSLNGLAQCTLHQKCIPGLCF